MCTEPTPCPASGGYFFCPGTYGCRSLALGPWMADSCTSQCLTPLQLPMYQFLMAQEEFDLYDGDNDYAPPGSNYIMTIELAPLPKLATLEHLDNGGPRPERCAYAVIVLMNNEKYGSQVMEVEVCALPTATTWRNLEGTVPKRKPGPISINSRPSSAAEEVRLYELLDELFDKLFDFLPVVFGGWQFELVAARNYTCKAKCITATWGAPRGGNSSVRKYWAWVTRLVEGMYLHVPGMEMLMDMTGLDPTEWKVAKIHLAGRLWDSPEEILEFFAANPGGDVTDLMTGLSDGTTVYKFNSELFYAPSDENASYSANQVRAPLSAARPASGRAGPSSQFEPHGKRYFITGPRHHAVLDALLDNEWGMGSFHYELVHGVDCPLNSVYLDFHTMWDSAEPAFRPRSVCMFEKKNDLPMRRHLDKDFLGSYKFYQGLPDNMLIIRSIAPVFNCNYMFDMILHTDGSLQFNVAMYGYPQGAKYANNGKEPTGFKYYSDQGGSFHQHFIHLKMDLDIAGRSNTLAYEEVYGGKIDRSVWDDTYPSTGRQPMVRTKVVPHKTAFKLNPARAQIFHVMAEGKRNRWGEKRGYMIHLEKYAHQAVDDEFLPAAHSWTSPQLVVTKRKDNEYFSCTLYEGSHPFTPVLDFMDFVDREYVKGQDIVIWATIGNNHVPTAEDAPSTNVNMGYGGLWLKPHNYFDEDRTRDLRETVLYITSTDYMAAAAPGTIIAESPALQVGFEYDFGMQT
ncbi:hypothetical protein FOA52_013086 [Chlamydomonas sp. UWO 241]|nr:hypothetical protein FOA52_013086 [Chlamydomonas sp. UWO 241]